jgi:hypothetical protein
MPERMMDHEIIESVGIEMEFSNLDRKSNKLQHTLHEKNLRNYRLVHDASCESMREFFADTDLPIEFAEEDALKTLAPIVRRAIIGGEIVSPIRHSGRKDWIKEIYNLVEVLQQFGEDESSERDAFHVHVNVSQSIPLYAMQNLLRITMNLEAILFRLGGMGRINRGVSNNYAFCRPFLGNGPPVISQQWRNGRISNIPICKPEEMMLSESKEEFFNRFGDSLHHARNGARYVTQRYMCVNFFPILTQGSFEFRTANKTLNPDYIIAWTNLCKAIVDKSFTSRDIESYDKVIRPLHENKEIPVEELLEALSYYDKLDEDTIAVLLDIWEKSPTPMFDNAWRFTHLREPTRFRDTKFAPKSLGEEPIEKATFIDIHHIQENDRNNPEIPLGGGLGPALRVGGRQFRAQRAAERIIRERRPPEIMVGQDTSAFLNEIPVHRMDVGYICNWDTDIFDINFERLPDNTIIFTVWDREEDMENTRIVADVAWFSLEQMIHDLHDGVPLGQVRLA